MAIEYHIIANGSLMYHVDRQRGYETVCDGCGEDFGTRWPHGILLAVITDRSGSEQASTHNREDCILASVPETLAGIYGGEPEDYEGMATMDDGGPK